MQQRQKAAHSHLFVRNVYVLEHDGCFCLRKMISVCGAAPLGGLFKLRPDLNLQSVSKPRIWGAIASLARAAVLHVCAPLDAPLEPPPQPIPQQTTNLDTAGQRIITVNFVDTSLPRLFPIHCHHLIWLLMAQGVLSLAPILSCDADNTCAFPRVAAGRPQPRSCVRCVQPALTGLPAHARPSPRWWVPWMATRVHSRNTGSQCVVHFAGSQCILPYAGSHCLATFTTGSDLSSFS